MPMVIARAVERVVLALCVPLLLWIGYRLLVRGVSGRMSLSAQQDKIRGKITNLTPGAFAFMLGVVLGAVSLVNGITAKSELYDAGGSDSSGRPVLRASQEISGSSGAGSAESPTAHARRALCEYARAVMGATSEADRTACFAKYLAGTFKDGVPPTETTLNEIAKLERRAAAGDVDAAKAVLDWSEAVFVRSPAAPVNAPK